MSVGSILDELMGCMVGRLEGGCLTRDMKLCMDHDRLQGDGSIGLDTHG